MTWNVPSLLYPFPSGIFVHQSPYCKSHLYLSISPPTPPHHHNSTAPSNILNWKLDFPIGNLSLALHVHKRQSRPWATWPPMTWLLPGIFWHSSHHPLFLLTDYLPLLVFSVSWEQVSYLTWFKKKKKKTHICWGMVSQDLSEIMRYYMATRI